MTDELRVGDRTYRTWRIANAERLAYSLKIEPENLPHSGADEDAMALAGWRPASERRDPGARTDAVLMQASARQAAARPDPGEERQ